MYIFSHNPGGLKSKIKVQEELGFGEASPPGLQNFLLCPQLVPWACVERQNSLVSLPLIKRPVLFDEGPTCMTSFNLNYFISPVAKYNHTGD